MKTTKEGMEEASGREDREDWFEKKECFELSKVERWSASNYGVNLAISDNTRHNTK